MKAKPLPRTEHHALERIKASHRRRAFWRDVKTLAVVATAGVVALAAALVIACIALGIPL